MKKQWKIPLTDLDYGQEEISAVTSVLKSRWLTLGERVAQFEEQIRTTYNVADAVMVSNGTVALHLALRAAGIMPGNEVIVPALTFVATSNAVLYCRGVPIFADIDAIDDPSISPEDIQRKITHNTRAVIVMHYGGYSCRLRDIKAVLREAEQRFGNRICLIEDAAHAIGGISDEQQWLGTAGDIGCFSFFSNKNLPVGEGGMVITDDPEIGKICRLLRSHALTRSTIEHHYYGLTDYDVVDEGYNYRPTEITAALALCQLKKLSRNNDLRAAITAYYRNVLSDIFAVTIPFPGSKCRGTPAFHIFPVLFRNKDEVIKVKEHLHNAGIQTSHHYRPIVDFSFYQRSWKTKSALVPLTARYSERQLTLPLYPQMKHDDVNYIVETLKKFPFQGI